MRISVSLYNEWLRCPLRAWWQYNKRTWTPGGKALKMGTAVHKYMEALSRTGRGVLPPETASDLVLELAPLLEHVPSDFLAREGMWYHQHEGRSCAEMQLSAKIYCPRIDTWVEVVGTLDDIAEDEEALWSLQFKTVAKGKPIGGELEKHRMSHHEMVYHWLAMENGIPLAGTALGTIRKLSQADLKANVPVWSLFRLERSRDEVVEFIADDFAPMLERMVADLEENKPPRNWLGCFDPYGNYRCPLFDACHNGVDADSITLEPMEDRYAGLGAEQ